MRGFQTMTRRVKFAAASMALTALAWGLPPIAAAQTEATSQQITDKVEDELWIDQAIQASKIDVETIDGIVRLSGTVDNLLSKQRAARIAEAVRGVRAVINQIEIARLTDRSDEQIEDDIEQELLLDPATESYEVSVDVENGTAKLTGSVDSYQEKQLAARVAMGVKGVQDFDNRIKVQYTSDRPDDEIRAEIEKTLRWDVLIDEELIEIQVENGEVQLIGTVGSASEMTRAHNSSWVAGVRSVDDRDLDVLPWAREEDLREERYATKSADEIRSALEDAFLLDPRVKSFNITPDVTGSIVTLRGRIDNLKAKRAAAHIARRTASVTTVINRIKVRPDADLVKTDAQIAESIRKSLSHDPYIERHEITVNVIDGTAYLYGTVDSFFEKSQAADKASRVYGVVEVVNNLSVEEVNEPYPYDPYVDEWYPYDYDWYDDYEPGFTQQSDSVIREEIEDEMWWSPFVDADEVQVTVDDGTATLTGTFDDYAEVDAAIENAYEGGATLVINELDVR